MAERDVRERDILVASNEYAYVQDLTKGDIVLYVGPTKISLSNTERLVELRSDRFVPMRGEDGGVAPFVSASSAQYVVLENPSKDPSARPVKGSNSAIELLTGRRVVVPGPASFPLWPGQKAKVVDGHALHEDQYLRLRVYDQVEGDPSPIGAQKIITGAQVSFYVPLTGLEVLLDERGVYVRNAVTLLDGQYCILRGPQGARRYVRGPSVVFPAPLEEFVQMSGNKIFAAYPLRKDRGLHVRAVKPVDATEGDQLPPGQYRAGQELFLQGQDGFFFPTEALEVLGEVAAIPLAEQEGLYVRELATGRVETITGPRLFLPDPTRYERVERVLSPDLAALYGLFAHNPARAIAIHVPPSYAVLVTARNKRAVVKGPQVRILDFDEGLEILQLSTGKPKTDDTLLPTCFLQTQGNKVSDIVRVRTSDHVELDVTVSYRVSFTSQEGKDDARWFNVKNYVALLCDHVGSIVRAAVRATPIERFHANGAEVVRTAILGEKRGEEKRLGRGFEENGMAVYDVEVLEVVIRDLDVKELLSSAQRAAITSEIARKQEELRLAGEQLKESVNREVYEAKLLSLAKEVELELGRRALAVTHAEARTEVDRLARVGQANILAQALEIESTAQAQAGARDAELAERERLSQVTAFRQQMEALQPELISTLKTLGNQQLAEALTKNLSPLAILGGDSVAQVAERLLQALPLGPDVTSNISRLLPRKQSER